MSMNGMETKALYATSDRIIFAETKKTSLLRAYRVDMADKVQQSEEIRCGLGPAAKRRPSLPSPKEVNGSWASPLLEQARI